VVGDAGIQMYRIRPVHKPKQTALAPSAGHTTDVSPPRKAFMVAVSSQSCNTTSMSTKQTTPFTIVVR